jgi:GT2 family glycosyltransferase
MNKDVSIIIVNYNTEKYIINCLNSVLEQVKDISYEIILVDNNSEDNSCKLLEESNFNNLTLIKSDKNLGFGKANNLGIKKALGEYIFLLNPDTILLNNVVKIFFDFMEETIKDNIGAVGGMLLYEDNEIQESFGNFPSITQVLFEFGLNRIFKNYYNQKLATGIKNYDLVKQEVPYLCAASIFFKKDVLEEVGAFDEDFFLYYEDTELCYRLKKAGYKIYFIPTAKVKHFQGKSDSPSLNKTLIIEKHKYLFYKKCYGNKKEFLAKSLYLVKYIFAYLITFKRKYLNYLKANIQLMISDK